MLEKDQFQRLRFQANMQIDRFSFIKILPKVLLLKQGDEKSKGKPNLKFGSNTKRLSIY